MPRGSGGSVPKGAAAKKAVAAAQAKRGITPEQAQQQAQLRQQQKLQQKQQNQAQRLGQQEQQEEDEEYYEQGFQQQAPRPKKLILRPDNPTHTCPFIAYAMAGATPQLEQLIRAKMLHDESKILYLGTTIVALPGVDLFPPLRLVDTRSGSTLLHFAALSNIETVRMLLSFGMTYFINAKNRSGATPVFLAAGRGHLDIVRFLIERGASITSHTAEGGSLLHSAVTSGNYELVKYLMSLPQIEVNVDDDEFMTPLGLAITRVSEIRKQLDEMDILMKESVKSMMVDSATFIMEENERVEARRIAKGISNSDETQTDPDLNFMSTNDHQIIMEDILANDKTIQQLKFGLSEGEKLVNNFIKITKLLLNPPVVKITVPEMIHEHRPKDVESIATRQRKRDEAQLALAKEVVDEETATPTTTTTETPQIDGEKKQDETNVQIPSTATTPIKEGDDNEPPALEVTDDPTIEIFEREGKLYTRRPAQQIFHTPDRAKVVHFAPYISYWMLLVETQELDLIEVCLESSEIDINWTFPMGDKVKNATALHYAIDLGNIKLAKLLIDHGANPGAEIDINVSLATLADSMPIPQRDGSEITPEQGADTTATETTPPQNNNTTLTSTGKLFPRNPSQVNPNAPPIIDLGLELLSVLCDNITKTTINYVTKTSYTTKSLAATTPEDQTKETQTPKPHQFHGFISKQQGFTPLLGALYNKNAEMAKFLVTYCQKRCLGPTYLSTHALTPYPTLLTPELLESLPPEDIERRLEEQEQRVATKLAQETKNQTSLTQTPPQITSFMDLLRTLSPFMTVNSNTIMIQRQKAQKQKKMEEQRKKMEEDEKFQNAKIGQHGNEETELDTIDAESDADEVQGGEEGDEDADVSPLDGVTSFIPDPLRLAITNGYDEVVHALLTLGVDTNTPYFQSNITMTKNRPLQSLTGEQYEYNVSIELTDMGFTPLFNAIKTKNTAIVRQLLSIGSRLDLSLYTYLLSLGMDINKTHYLPLYNEDYDKELIAAAENGEELMKIAQISQKTAPAVDGSSSSKKSPGLKSPAPQQQLIRIDFYSPTASLPAIIQSVQYHPDVLHMLVAHKNDILTQTTNDLRTALHYSCDLNKPVLSTYLLSNNPLAMYDREQAGLTPLSLAVASDHAEVSKILLSFLRTTRSPLVVFHPHRPTLVFGDEADLDDGLSRVEEYYGQIDQKFDFYPRVLPGKPQSEDHLDDIDTEAHEDDMKTSDEDDVYPNGQVNKKSKKEDEKQNVVRPYWVDLIVEQEQAPFIFSPKGFDRPSFEQYHKYITSQYYPVLDEKSLPTNTQAPPQITQIDSTSTTTTSPAPPTTFTTYHQIYENEEFNPVRQQLQTQPLRWLGFDIACANIMSFYYSIVNNPRDLENEPLIPTLAPFINSIDGLYGHVIRAFRIAAMGGSIFSLKQLSAAMVAYPQIRATDSELPSLETIFSQNLTPVPTKPHALWVELIVPTEEQLATRIATAGGYQLLENNIIVDQHGFIARNITYQYACEFHRNTLSKGMISSTRLCLPMVTYLSTEILSTISKQGSTFLLGEALGNQAFPLLHGLRGTTFIRCFHQFYTCNPLFYDRTRQNFNFSGIIRNRTKSLPFTPFMKSDLGEVQIPISTGTRHFIVSKSIITERLKQEVVKKYIAQQTGDEDVELPPLIDTKPNQVMTPIQVYKVSTFSPLHLAVVNDHVGLIRLLIGLAPFPDQEEKTEGEDVSEFSTDGLTSLGPEEESNDDNGNSTTALEESDVDPDMPKAELVGVDDDSDNSESVSVTKVLDDIMLQPRQTQTLTHLVKALNILPDSQDTFSPFGSDLGQDDEDDEAEEESTEEQKMTKKAEKQQRQQAQQEQMQQQMIAQQLNPEDEEYDPKDDPLFAGIDLQALLSQAIEDTKKTEEEEQGKAKLTNRLSKLPPLLHVPQPSDPIFQLINRLAVRPIETEVEAKAEDGTITMERTTIQSIVHPLHLCALHDLVDSADVLIQYGAIIDIQDHDGNTPLHIAIRDESRLILDVLLSYSASLNLQNKDGNTPVHMAILTGQIDLAKVLLEEYQPDLTLKNNDGKTAKELLDENEEKYRQFIQTESVAEDDILPLEALFTSTKEKVKLNTKAMSAEEKRKHNIQQIKMLKTELDKIQQQ